MELQKSGGNTLIVQQRYYHFFRSGELAELGRKAGFRVDQEAGLGLYEQIYGKSAPADEYFDHDNWYCVFAKD